MKILIIIFFIIYGNLKSETYLNKEELSVIMTINKTMKTLKENLENALQDGDITEAFKMCSDKAQDLTFNNNNNNTTIKRISLKYRNPKNKPTKYEEEILRSFENKLLSGVKFNELIFKKVTNNYKNKTLVYLKAIPTKGVCLNCHGKNIDDKVFEKIKAVYPNDMAIGYRLGEIRGAFSVRHNF